MCFASYHGFSPDELSLWLNLANNLAAVGDYFSSLEFCLELCLLNTTTEPDMAMTAKRAMTRGSMLPNGAPSGNTPPAAVEFSETAFCDWAIVNVEVLEGAVEKVLLEVVTFETVVVK
jgi:hypothetical protein